MISPSPPSEPEPELEFKQPPTWFSSGNDIDVLLHDAANVVDWFCVESSNVVVPVKVASKS